MSATRPMVQRVLAYAFAVLAIQILLLESSTEQNHVVPLVTTSEAFDGSISTLVSNTRPSRYSDLLALSDGFAGSRVFESGLLPEHRWSRSLMGGIGRVGQVSSGDGSTLPSVRLAPVEKSGRSTRGEWTILAVERGARDFAYVSISANEYAYIDLMLIPRVASVGEDAIVFRRPADYDGHLVALKEWCLFAALLFLGLVLLRGTQLAGRIRPWAAFPVGLSALSATGVLLPRGAMGLAFICGAASALVVFRIFGPERARFRSALGLDGCSVHHLAVAIITFGVVSSTARRFRLYFVTTDSFDYLSGAYTLGLGRGSFASGTLDTSFFIGQQAIHAAGYALDIGPLFSVGWVLFVCALMILAGLARDSWFSDVIGNPLVGAFLIVGIASASPYVWRFAAYVNAHMFVATLLLLLLLLCADSSQPRHLRFGLSLLLFSAFIFTRGEAPLVIALMLLGLSSGSSTEQPRTADLWLALAIPNFAWGALVLGLSRGDTEVPRSVLLSVAIGGACVIAYVLARSPVVARRLSALWVVPWIGLGVVHVAAQRAVPGGLSEPIRAMRDNTLNLASAAGAVPLIMLLLAVVLAVAKPSPDTRPLEGVRTLVLGFLPTVLLARAAAPIAWSLGSSTDSRLDFIVRTGFGDSTNRITFHLWFLLIAGFLMGPGRIQAPRGLSGWIRTLAFLTALTVAAQQWVAQILPWTDPYRWIGWVLVALFAGLLLHRSSVERLPDQREELSPDSRLDEGRRSSP